MRVTHLPKIIVVALFAHLLRGQIAPSIGTTAYLDGVALQNDGVHFATASPDYFHTLSGTFIPGSNPLVFGYFTFDVWPAPQYSCKIGINFTDNSAFLHDDEGNPKQEVVLGGGGSDSNSKCRLSAAGSSITPVGSNFNVTVNVSFTSPYYGTKYVYLNALDGNNLGSGWVNPYAAFIVNGTSQPPTVISVSPSSGVSKPGDYQFFEATISSPSGAYSIYHAELVFLQGANWMPGYTGQSSSNPSKCKVVLEVSAHLHWMQDFNNGNTGYVGDSAPPSTLPECNFYVGDPSIYVRYNNINTVVLGFGVSLSSSFGQDPTPQPLQTHVYAATNAGQVVWDTQANGTWTWNTTSNVGPIPSTFLNCISASGNGNCQLSPNNDGNGHTIPYLVNSVVSVGRSNLVVSGLPGATLQRGHDYYSGPPSFSPLLSLGYGINNVTIQSLTFDGNRGGMVSSRGLQRISDVCVGIGANCSDVSAGDSASGVTFSGNDFRNASQYSLLLNNPTAVTTIQNISVLSNRFSNAYFTGMLIAGQGPSSSTPGYQESGKAYWNYNLCSSADKFVGIPTNLTIRDNTFEGALSSGIAVNEAQTTRISGNRFYNNYYGNASYNTGGGSAVFLSPCTLDTTISNNIIDASLVQNPNIQGLELDGQKIQVNNNQIANIPSAGILLSGVTNVTISDNPQGQVDAAGTPNISGFVKNTSRYQPYYFPSGGIFFRNITSYGSGSEAVPIRPNGNVSVSGTTSQGNGAGSGVMFYSDGLGFVSPISIVGNCFDPAPTPSVGFLGSANGSGLTVYNNQLTGCF